MSNVTISNVEERLLSSKARTNTQPHHSGHDIKREGAKEKGVNGFLVYNDLNSHARRPLIIQRKQ